MTAKNDEIVSADDLQPQLEGDRVTKEDLLGKEIIVNLENMVVVMDGDKPDFTIIQFTMPETKDKLYTTTIGSVPMKKFIAGKDRDVKKTKGHLVKVDRENPKKGEHSFYWDFVGK